MPPSREILLLFALPFLRMRKRSYLLKKESTRSNDDKLTRRITVSHPMILLMGLLTYSPISMHLWMQKGASYPGPVRLCRNGGYDMGEEKGAEDEKYPLCEFMISLHDKQPYYDGSHRHRNILAHSKDVHASGHTGKLCHDIAYIGRQQSDEDKEGYLDAGILSYQIGQPIAGHNALFSWMKQYIK